MFRQNNLPKLRLYIANEVVLKQPLDFQHISLSVSDQDAEKDSGYSSDEEEEEKKAETT